MTTKNGMHSFQAVAKITMVAALAVLAATGVKAQDGVSKTAITLGQSLAMTGPGVTLATPFGQGRAALL
jgi:branched-chain amino acid transport system substrate-binding protein